MKTKFEVHYVDQDETYFVLAVHAYDPEEAAEVIEEYICPDGSVIGVFNTESFVDQFSRIYN